MPLMFHLENEEEDENDENSVSDKNTFSKLTSKKESTEMAYSQNSPNKRGNSPSSKKSSSSPRPKKKPKIKKPNENLYPKVDPKEKFRSLMNYIDHERAINNPFIKIRDENPSSHTGGVKSMMLPPKSHT